MRSRAQGGDRHGAWLDHKMISEGSGARLEGDVWSGEQGLQIFDPFNGNLRTDDPEVGVFPENNFCPGIEQDSGGDGMKGIVVDVKTFDHTRLEAAVKYPGFTGNNAFACGQLQGHGNSVFSIFKIFVQVIGLP